jgi:hypothetical protein
LCQSHGHGLPRTGLLFGQREPGLTPGVDATFENGDVLEAKFLHEEGCVAGTGSDGAIDEGRTGEVERFEAFAGLFGFEVIDVVGALEVAVAELILHAAIDDLESRLSSDQIPGGDGVEETDSLRKSDDGGRQLRGWRRIRLAGCEGEQGKEGKESHDQGAGVSGGLALAMASR